MRGEIKCDWNLVTTVAVAADAGRRSFADAMNFGQIFPAEMRRLEMADEGVEREPCNQLLHTMSVFSEGKKILVPTWCKKLSGACL